MSVPGFDVEEGPRLRPRLTPGVDSLAEADMLVIGLAMCARNPAWRDALVAKVRAELEGLPPDERMTHALFMLTKKPAP